MSRKTVALMRERLIELLHYVAKNVKKFKTSGFIESLADYLLANGVIVQPCEFQQKVYVLPTIENGLQDITEMKCIGFSLSFDSYVANLITDKNKLYQPGFGRFGKTVFLTKEEAEAALRGSAEQ